MKLSCTAWDLRVDDATRFIDIGLCVNAEDFCGQVGHYLKIESGKLACEI
jgi:hypothetical protein